MKAIELTVHNFRSLKDATVELNPFTLVVGPNNAGKSNLLAAIRVFYEKGSDKTSKFDESRDLPKFPTADEESWVEIRYSLTPEEVSTLKEEYRAADGSLRIRKYLRGRTTDESGEVRSGLYPYVGGVLAGSRFYGAKNVQQAKLGNIIFVPAVSRIEDQTKLSGPSALRDLLDVVLSDVLAGSTDYAALSTAIGEFGKRLKHGVAVDGRSVEALEKSVSDELEGWGTRFEIEIAAIAPEDILKTLVGHRLIDESLGQGLDSAAFGVGLQRQLAFALIKLAASLGQKKPSAKKKDFAPDLDWLVFEEPEAFLHPPQLDILQEQLRAYAADPGRQVTVSSHSPQLASRNMEDLPSIVRLNRRDGVTEVGQVRARDLPALLEANQHVIEELRAAGQDVTDDDAQLAMEEVKYALWLNPLRSSCFFAQNVLLVEGASERSLIEFLIHGGELRSPKGGVAVVDTLGNWNTHRFMNLLGRLRVPHAVLYDRDGGKEAALVLERAIQAVKNDHTRGIDHLPKNLEDSLGVPPPGRQDRKPQHIMYLLRKDRIPADRKEAFCRQVQSLLNSFSTAGQPTTSETPPLKGD
jgi:putative ATP-dependent endonuclease of the OLD family